MTEKSRRFLICFLFVSQLAFSQNKQANVTFVVTDTKPLIGKNIFITGNNDLLGNWNPSLIKLNKVSDSVWNISFNFDIGTNLEYKFTRGSWSEEALDEKLQTPPNSKLLVKTDTIVNVIIHNWLKSEHRLTSTRVGKIIEHKNFTYDGLRPRDISVKLPESYDKNPNKRYPVLYMHDGQNIFDAMTSFGGTEWRVDEISDSLAKINLTKEIIIVGINNTIDRRPEYSNTPLGEKYCHLIIDSIKPFIDKNYRTLRDRKNTAVAGSSMGGLISFILGWEYAEVFSMVGSFSPALKVQLNDTMWIDYLSTVEKTKKKRPIKIYIDNGSQFDERLQPGVDEALKLLKKLGYKERKDLMYVKDAISNHNEAAWSKRFPEFMKFMFRK